MSNNEESFSYGCFSPEDRGPRLFPDSFIFTQCEVCLRPFAYKKHSTPTKGHKGLHERLNKKRSCCTKCSTQLKR